MSFPTYISGTPKDGSTLGNTKAKIRNNLDGTFNALAVDHITQNGATPGYHTLIHQVTQTAVTAISGVNQVFSGVPGVLTWTNMAGTFTTAAIPTGGDTQLFSLTGNGGLSQLTGNYAASEGISWVGGILVQWGFVNNTAASIGSVTFNSRTNCAAFPTNCFIVIPGAVGTSANLVRAPCVNTITKNGFNWAFGSTANITGFNWFAIGN